MYYYKASKNVFDKDLNCIKKNIRKQKIQKQKRMQKLRISVRNKSRLYGRII